MNYVFLVLKKFDSWSKKCHFRTIFGAYPVKFPPIFFWKIFTAPKESGSFPPLRAFYRNFWTKKGPKVNENRRLDFAVSEARDM